MSNANDLKTALKHNDRKEIVRIFQTMLNTLDVNHNKIAELKEFNQLHEKQRLRFVSQIAELKGLLKFTRSRLKHKGLSTTEIDGVLGIDYVDTDNITEESDSE